VPRKASTTGSSRNDGLVSRNHTFSLILPPFRLA
jgi:hypothetical protein